MSTVIEEAQAIVARGFPVFPCFDVWEFNGKLRCRCGKSDCSDAGKHPVGHLVKNGLHSATRDLKQVETWWHSRTWNVGLVTGGKAIVLDVDPKHGGNESLAGLEGEHGPLPDTWRSFTGSGGEHIFFAPPADRPIGNSIGMIAPGLDIRGRGGYVVAPPSRHISGGTYDWNVDLHPDEVPLAPMPDWLVRACGTPTTGSGKKDIASLAVRDVAEGGRNATITSLTGHLLRRYVDPHMTLALMAAWNQVRCAPPLPLDEVAKILNSIASRELKRREGRR